MRCTITSIISFKKVSNALVNKHILNVSYCWPRLYTRNILAPPIVDKIPRLVLMGSEQQSLMHYSFLGQYCMPYPSLLSIPSIFIDMLPSFNIDILNPGEFSKSVLLTMSFITLLKLADNNLSASPPFVPFLVLYLQRNSGNAE